MANRDKNLDAEQNMAIENLKGAASQVADEVEADDNNSHPKARNNGDDTVQIESLKGRAHDDKDFQRYLDGADLRRS